MAKSPDSFDDFIKNLSELGLLPLGVLELSASECPASSSNLIGSQAVIIGNAGSRMWQVCSSAEEFQDGLKDPMNRWTRRVLDAASTNVEANAVYPFDKPFWPFQRIMNKAIGISQSPLGILIHPDYGLWHAYRGMIVFPQTHKFNKEISRLGDDAKNLNHPCNTCVDKPCLSACPVNAFSDGGLSTTKCFAHLDTMQAPRCLDLGCAARASCPVGQEYYYEASHLAFHMRSFRGL